MKNTTLCYITQGQQVLMLHRVKKEHDLNKDKWIGIGGKFEENESPEECLLREAKEETGLTLTDYRYCGIVTLDYPGFSGQASQVGGRPNLPGPHVETGSLLLSETVL